MTKWFKDFKDGDWRVQALRVVSLLFGLALWAFLSLPSVTYTEANPDASLAYRAVDELFTGNFNFPGHAETLIPAGWSVGGYILGTIFALFIFINNRPTGYLYYLLGTAVSFTLIALQPVFTIRHFYEQDYSEANNVFGLGYIMPLILSFMLVAMAAYLYVLWRNNKKQTQN